MNASATPAAADRHLLLPWLCTAFFGAASGLTGWYAAVWARAYCDAAFEPGDRFGLLYLWLPLSALGGSAYACLALALGRLLARRHLLAARLRLPAVLAVLTAVSLVWCLIATLGTPAGPPRPPFHCPRSNVPPPWPNWLPL